MLMSPSRQCLQRLVSGAAGLQAAAARHARWHGSHSGMAKLMREARHLLQQHSGRSGLQMTMFAATLCAGEVVGCLSTPGLAAAPHLPTAATAWGLLLPCTLTLSALVPGPPEEQAALRILGDPDAAAKGFVAGHRQGTC